MFFNRARWSMWGLPFLVGALSACSDGSPGPAEGPATTGEPDNPPCHAHDRPIPGDFDTNGWTDILWRKDENGLVKLKLWHMDGVKCLDEVDVTSPGTPDSNWRIEGVGDFDGDKDADILWRHQISRKIVVWIMKDADHAGGGYVDAACDPSLDAAWEIAGTGDFNDDKKADIFFQKIGSPDLDLELKVWYMDGLKCTSTESTSGKKSGAWKVLGGGYFTSNSSNVQAQGSQKDTDTLWRNGNSGRVTIWYHDGFDHVGGEFTDPDGTAVYGQQDIVAIGQYGEHRCTDILWQAKHDVDKGKLEAWLMEGPRRLATQSIEPCSLIYGDPTWEVVGPH